MKLLDNDELGASAVVANNAMNRERRLTGVNSYARELGFDPLDRLRTRLASTPVVRWLDLCCGRARALWEAAERLHAEGFTERVALVGVDLVDHFDPAPRPGLPVTLVAAPLDTWTPTEHFDLITCVHGLHYVGDKVGALTRTVEMLTDDGEFVADLDLAGIRLADGAPAGRALTTALRHAGFSYDARRRRIRRTGHGEVTLPYRYLGADDRAGANYTRQPAVDSWYERL